jgi:hypothetical protein
MWLQILGTHPVIKADQGFLAFLRSPSAEFEAFKKDLQEGRPEPWLALQSLKHFQLQDTLSYIYSSLKSKCFAKKEPQELQCGLQLEAIEKRIAQEMPILDTCIASLQSLVAFKQKHVDAQEELATYLEDIEESDEDLERTFVSTGEYFLKYGFVVQVSLDGQVQDCARYDVKLLGHVREEKLKLEGIITAIRQRKAVQS